MSATLASIVIPTRNRREVVLRTLSALDAQDAGATVFDVIVVANGCTDGTADAVRATRYGFRCCVVELDTAGASLARNAGAQAGKGALLVFLDDDITVVPGFVRAHLSAHASAGDRTTRARVAIGYLATALQPPGDRFAIALRAWWEAMFDRMRMPGHRAAYSDLLSGNCSLPRALFEQVGGFDLALRCHEDYELGYRLIEAGASFVFVEAAMGRHFDETRLARACWRKREEGRADVFLARKHSALRTGLPLAHTRTIKQRVLRWLAFNWPAGGAALTHALAATLPLLERTGATMTWGRVLYAIFGYWYARGLADVLPAHADLQQLMHGAWDEVRTRDAGPLIDLSEGLEAAAARLDRLRPDSARLVVGRTVVGQVDWRPGSERLAGRHLAPLLAHSYALDYVRALLTEGRLRLDEMGAPSRPAPAPPGTGSTLAALRS